MVLRPETELAGDALTVPEIPDVFSGPVTA
jgi:hypothetical protein